MAGVTGIAPENIERVEVVKGGAAQAAYGSEAAGGMLYILTKDAPEDFKALQLRPAPGESESVRPAPSGGGVVKLRTASDARVHIDGALFEGDIESIDKNTIDRIEVVKGKEAGGPSSIYITLKRLSR